MILFNSFANYNNCSGSSKFKLSSKVLGREIKENTFIYHPHCDFYCVLFPQKHKQLGWNFINENDLPKMIPTTRWHTYMYYQNRYILQHEFKAKHGSWLWRQTSTILVTWLCQIEKLNACDHIPISLRTLPVQLVVRISESTILVEAHNASTESFL